MPLAEQVLVGHERLHIQALVWLLCQVLLTMHTLGFYSPSRARESRLSRWLWMSVKACQHGALSYDDQSERWVNTRRAKCASLRPRAAEFHGCKPR